MKWAGSLGLAGLMLAQQALAISIGGIEIGNPFKTGIPISVLVDAKFPEVAKLNRIAVTTFGGPAGGDFTASLRDELSSAELNGEKVFLISGTFEARSGDSARNMVEQARRAGIDAVYVGDTAIVAPRAMPKKEQYCEGGRMLVGDKCRGFGGTEDVKTRTCWTVSGTFTANVKVIRTSDGNTVYEERKSETAEEKFCDTAVAGMMQPNELALQAKDQVIAAIKTEIMPRTEIQRVKLMSSTRKMSKADKEVFQDARGWAQQEDLNRACGMWEELSETSQDDAGEHVSVIYNLGVCAEYQGDYKNALARYRAAKARAKSRDGKLITAGIDRVQSAQAAAGR